MTRRTGEKKSYIVDINIICIIFIFNLLPFFLKAQFQGVDTFLIEVQKAKSFEQLEGTLDDLIATNLRKSFVIVRQYLNNNVPSYLNIQQQIFIRSKAGILYVQDDSKYSIEVAKWALSELKKYRNTDQFLYEIYLSLGALYNNVGNNKEALIAYQNAERITLTNKAVRLDGSLLINVANLYLSEKEIDSAISNFQQVLELEELTLFLESNALLGLGLCQLELNRLQVAGDYFKKAMKLAHENKDNNVYYTSLNNLAITYELSKKFDLAINAYDQVESFYRKIKNREGEGNVSIDKAYLYQSKNDIDNAIQYATRSFECYQAIDFLAGMSTAKHLQSTLYTEKKDFQKAFESLQQFTIYKDSLSKISNKAELTAIKKDFEYEQARILTKAKHESQIEKEKTIQKYLVLLVVLALATLMLLLYSYRAKIKNLNTIKSQKSEIEALYETNEDLISTLTHDIKEPLLGVQILLKKLPIVDDKIVKAKASLDSQLSSVNNILVNLLAAKNVQSNNEQLLSSEVKDLIDALVKQFEPKLQEKHITVTVSHLRNDFSISIPKNKLFIILYNLLSNAIKFSYPNGIIEIGENHNALYVKDFGKGLDQSTLVSLGKAPLTATVGTADELGTGNGIYIVNKMAKAMGYTLQYQSTPNQGTQVNIVKIA